MNKFIIILFFILFFNPNTFAQYQIGIRTGVNLSFQYIENSDFDLENMNKKYGLNAALILNKPIFSFLSFQPQIIYSQKGVRYTGSLSNYKLSIDYFELQTNIKLHSYLFPIYIIGSPYISYCLSASSQINTEEPVIEEIGKNNLLFYDFGISAGIGMQKDLGVIKLFIEGRYEFGFVDINALQNSAGLEIINKNKNIAVFGGILYKFNRFFPE